MSQNQIKFLFHYIKSREYIYDKYKYTIHIYYNT